MYDPGLRLFLLIGTVFVLVGVLIPVVAGSPTLEAKWGWPVVATFCGAFVLFGGIAMVLSLKRLIWPARIRHAAPNVLLNVPNEPVPLEGSTLHGRLTHELVETVEGWELRPSAVIWRNDKRFLLGFGIPFSIASVGLITWYFHSRSAHLSWPLSASIATLITALCGGTVFLLMGLMMRASYRRLSTLSIPRAGADMWFESPEPLNDKLDLSSGLQYVFVGPAKGQRITIPRASLVAVQLCPWKFVVGGSGTRSMSWGVQGLLVLAPGKESVYRRVPILLTGDAAKAARLMHRLAGILRVPFLFGADEAGWKAETMRAKSRPPMQAGGLVS